MSKNQRRATRKMLHADNSLPQDTILSDTSGHILTTAESLRSISNIISKTIGRKVSTAEVGMLDKFISRLPGSRFANKSLITAQREIADQFIYKSKMQDEIPAENENLESLIHLDDGATMQDAQRAELNGLTPNENPHKMSMFRDRQGRSVVSRERAGEASVYANRSAPHNLLNQEGRDLADADGAHTGQASVEAAMRVQQRVNKELLKSIRTLNGTFNPESIDGIFSRSVNSLASFNNINLPHQVVPLDSRFRLVDQGSNSEYKWNVHTASDAGRPGDIRMQDTLTQIMMMKICPFWIPVSQARYGYYEKIRMYIKEFKGQSIQVNEFLDGSSARNIRSSNYHFEFLIDRREVNRIHLIPICPEFTFRMPIAQVNTLSVTFRSPFELIEFDDDRLFFTVSNANPAVFTSISDHRLATGDLVYVTNFQDPAVVMTASFTATCVLNVTAIAGTPIVIGATVVGNGVKEGTYITSFGTGVGGVGTYNTGRANTIGAIGSAGVVVSTNDAEVNQVEGHFITRLSNTTFSIPVDLSTVPSSVSNVEVEFGSKRIVTQIEFVSLEQ
jgi:hypothetical protein